MYSVVNASKFEFFWGGLAFYLFTETLEEKVCKNEGKTSFLIFVFNSSSWIVWGTGEGRERALSVSGRRSSALAGNFHLPKVSE